MITGLSAAPLSLAYLLPAAGSVLGLLHCGGGGVKAGRTGTTICYNDGLKGNTMVDNRHILEVC